METLKKIFLFFTFRLGVVGCLTVLLGGFIISSFTIPYVINSWLVYVHHQAQVHWWQGALLGGFIPPIAIWGIFGALATWIAMMFLE